MGFLAQFDAFHEQAMQLTGLDDFGAADYREPMRLLLSDYDRHAEFNPVGTAMIRGEIVGRLAGRLMTELGLKQWPSCVDAPIERPLVVVGMARTGTTALLRLLSQDPGVQALPPWLACAPMPRPPRATWETNPCYQQMVQALEQIYALSPQIRTIHPMVASEPDECRFALNHSFWAPDCSTTAPLPDYADWVLDCDARYAYRYYRRVLNLIGTGDQRRWVLKDVCHLFNFDALLDSFPDACVVLTHRDPLTAMTSVASLILLLRQLREPRVDLLEHGRWILRNWGAAQDRTERIRRRYPAERFIDIHNDETRDDPLGVVERIYRQFNLPITAEARTAWARRSVDDPRSGHGVHDYKPEDFGFGRENVNAAVGEYLQRYEEVAGNQSRS